MNITTYHKFIDLYQVKQNYKAAIIGTIHPHNIDNFLFKYFYGNVGSLWGILGNAFPQHNFNSVKSIKETLDKYGVWVTDIIKQCDRDDEKITDDRSLKNIVLNKDAIKKGLESSDIDKIFFTSAFGKNNAAKLFTDVFNINYKTTLNPTTREFVIPKRYFGRQVTGVLLYSPSGQANIGISKSLVYLDKIDYYQQFEQPVKEFKIDFYRSKFDIFNSKL